MHHRHHAFTLLELAGVLVIVSLMTGFGLQVFQTSSGMDCYAATESQLKVINRAMETFAAKDSRLPKPAFPSLGSSSPRFGMEATDGPDAGVVPDDRTVAAYGSMVPVDPDVTGAMSSTGAGVNQVLIGALPHSDLGLSVDYASDCWGNKFTYAVTNVLTSKDGATGYPSSTAVGAITLNAGSIATPSMMSDKIDYVVISHGMNKFGATAMSAGNVAIANNCNGSPGTIIDKENCDTTNATFFNAVRNIGSGAVDYFDDLVVFGKNLAKGGGGETNLYCWGTDNSGLGVLADNSTVGGHFSYTPKKAESTASFSQFAEILPTTITGTATGCALTCDGTPYCWGRNDYGQIGDNTLINKPVPTAATTSIKFSKLYIAGGYNPTVCGLRANADGTTEGTVYCWGNNNSGRAGINSLSPNRVQVPTAVVTAIKFKQLAAKDMTMCGLAMNSSVYCWGGNMVDRADGATADSYAPVIVQGGRKFSSIRGGALFCGITNGLDPLGAGKIFCWGTSRNLNDRGVYLSEEIPISAITQANPGVVTTSVPHGLIARDQFFIRRAEGMGLVNNLGTRFTGSAVLSNNTSYGFYNVANNTTIPTTTTVRLSTGLDDSFTGLNTSNAANYPAYTGGGVLIITGSAMPRLLPGQAGLTFASFGKSGEDVPTHYTGISAVTVDGKLYTWGNTATTLNFANLGNGIAAVSPGTSYGAPPPVSRSNPALVTVPAAHGLVTGDSVWMDSVPGMTQLTPGIYKVGSTPTANSFTIQDLSGTPINSTGFSAATGGGGSYDKVPNDCWSKGTYINKCTYSPVQPTASPNVNNGSMVAYGGYYVRSFINSAGQVKSWGTQYIGDNTSNTRNSPVDIRGTGGAAISNVFTRLFNLSDFMIAIDTDGNAFSWGQNNSGVRGNGVSTDRYQATPVSGGLKWIDFQRVQGSAATCGLTPEATACPAPTACGDETIYWGSGCAAQTGTRAQGANATINNQSVGRSGNADISCNNGSYIVSNTSCAANGCAAQTINWGPGNVCSFNIGAQLDGDSALINPSSPSYTGQATVSCTAGTTNVTGTTCYANCIAGTVNWGACSGPAGAANHAAPGAVVANTTSGQVGNVTVTCNNGSFTQSSATCAPVPPSNCNSQTVSWGTGCSATAPALNHNDNTSVSNVAAGRVGTATASCSNGTTTASGSCNLHCSGRSETWGGTCAGTTPAMNHGDSQSVSNTNGGFTGAVTMGCTNGSLGQSSASCAAISLPSNGKLYCWGYNSRGQIGDGTSTNRESPANVVNPVGVTGWSMVSSASHHTCGIGNDGRAYCWGFNSNGPFGNGTTTNSTTATPVTNPSGVTSWKYITASRDYSCGIGNNDRLYCFGIGYDFTYLPTAVGTDTWSKVQATGDAGTSTVCGVRISGQGYCWNGSNYYGTYGDGTTTNKNAPSLVTFPAGVTAWKMITPGSLHTCGIGNNDRAYCWGHGGHGQLGDGSNTDTLIPRLVTDPSGVTSWKTISAGYRHTCGIGNNNLAYCWGLVTNGSAVGDSTTNQRSLPTLVTNPSGVTSWTAISAGGRGHSCGIGNNGRTYCWGDDLYMALGNSSANSHTTSPMAVDVPFGDFVFVSATGEMNSCAISTAVCDEDASDGLTAGQKFCSGVTVRSGSANIVCYNGIYGPWPGYAYGCGATEKAKCLSGNATTQNVGDTSGCSYPDCSNGDTYDEMNCLDGQSCVCN